MHRLVDRFILILLIALAAFLNNMDSAMYVLLGAVITASFGYRLCESRFHLVVVIGSLVSMLVWDAFIPLIVLAVYEVTFTTIKNKRKEWVVVAITAVVIFIKYLVGYVVIAELLELIVVAIGIIIAGFLAFQSYNVEKYRDRAISLADDSEDAKRRLAEKNRYLIQKQDDEITMATLKERNRIAREIHDNVGHLLSRSILQVGALMTINKEEPTATFLKQINDTLNESMTSIRSSVHNLHNESLDLNRSITDIMEKHDNVKSSLDYSIQTDMPIKTKYCFIAIISEGFENFRKHSNGDSVMISVVEHPAFYKLVFSDNGVISKVHETGIGLHNMQARVEEVGGVLTINTEHGFRIFVSVPKGENNESNNH